MLILAVDDDADLLKLLKLRLEAKGHTVITHQHGLGVISQLAAWDGFERPDLCILDNWMPEANGLSLLKLAAQTHRARDVPILFYSADAGLHDEVEACGHPHVLYLVKGRVTDVLEAVDTLESTGRLGRF